VTDADLAKYIAALDKLPCGCTVNHVGRCLDALELWEKIAGKPSSPDEPREPGLWSKYSGAPGIFHDEYFALCAEYLAHFENSHAPAPGAEAVAERVGMEVGL